MQIVSNERRMLAFVRAFETILNSFNPSTEK